MNAPTPSIQRFADTYLSSVDDLHVLIACVENADRWWSATAMADILRIPLATARASLDHLTRRNLLDIHISGDVRYRFRPGTHDLERQAHSFVEAYRRNPLQIAQSMGIQGLRPKA
jgi:DNA-binding IclR family transcriptional regulator